MQTLPGTEKSCTLANTTTHVVSQYQFHFGGTEGQSDLTDSGLQRALLDPSTLRTHSTQEAGEKMPEKVDGSISKGLAWLVSREVKRTQGLCTLSHRSESPN